MNDDDFQRSKEDYLEALREALEDGDPSTVTLHPPPPKDFSAFNVATRQAEAEITDGLGVPSRTVERRVSFSSAHVGPTIRDMMAEDTERAIADHLAALMVYSAMKIVIAVAERELEGWPAVCGAVCYAAVEKAYDHLSFKLLLLRRDLEFLKGGPPSPGQPPDDSAGE